MKYSIVLPLFIMLTACSTSDNNDGTTLIGTWLTQACTQGTESNGFPINTWFKGKYEFATSGFLFFEQEQYVDSQCINKAPSLTQDNLDFLITYTDLGPVTLQEGIQGNEIIIVANVASNSNVELQGFYTINNSVLCFSDIFTFWSLFFDLSGSGGDAINFTDCLVKLKP